MANILVNNKSYACSDDPYTGWSGGDLYYTTIVNGSRPSVDLNGVELYGQAHSTTVANTLSGTYWILGFYCVKGQTIIQEDANNSHPVLLTNSATGTGTTGWINQSHLPKGPNTYTVTFYYEDFWTLETIKTVTEGAPCTTPNPTRTGYTFQGWYTSEGSYVVGGNQSYIPTSNIDLYAHWKRNTYTLTYDANGGTGAPSSTTAEYNTAFNVSTIVPSRSGYDFLGWSYGPTGNPYYQPGGRISISSNTTLYAVWKGSNANWKKVGQGYLFVYKDLEDISRWVTMTPYINVKPTNSTSNSGANWKKCEIYINKQK